MVTSAGKSGYCNHVKGSVEIDEVDDESTEGFPSSCLLKSVWSVESCESYCTSQSSCIGYTYHLGPNPEIATRLSDCHLFTSNSICPNGFEYFQRKFHLIWLWKQNMRLCSKSVSTCKPKLEHHLNLV